MLRSLATEQDVANVLSLYTDFFADGVPSSEEVALQDQSLSLGFKFGEPLSDADPGVEIESLMRPEDLRNNLGFTNGLPLLFNSHRHRGGLNAWDPANALVFESSSTSSNSDMLPLSLHWHQLAGVHALVRMNFTPEEASGRCCGVLIADEVGLGKTFQAIATLAFLSDLKIRGENNLPLPPMIGESILVPFRLFNQLTPPPLSDQPLHRWT